MSASRTVIILLLCVPLGFALPQSRPGPVPVPRDVIVDRNLVYARADEKDLLLDIYRPAKQEGLLPREDTWLRWSASLI